MTPNSTLDDLLGPMLGALLAFALLAGARIFARMNRKLEGEVRRLFAQPTGAIASARAGVATKVSGTVIADSTLTSPLTGRSGVLCEVVAIVDVGDGARRDTLATERRPFCIEDASGARIRVHAEGARLIALPDRFVEDPTPAHPTLTASQRAWVQERTRDRRASSGVEEVVVSPGQSIFVTGVPREENGGLALGGGSSEGLTLVTGTERAHLDSFEAERGLLKLLSRAGAAVLAASLAWAAWTLLR